MQNTTDSDKKNYTADAGVMLRNRLAKDCYPKLKLTMTQRAQLTDIALAMNRQNQAIAKAKKTLEGLNTNETAQLLSSTKPR